MAYEAIIVFLPLLGALLAGLFGRVLGDRGAEITTTLFLVIAAVLSCVAFYNVALMGGAKTITIANFITSGDLVVDWSLRIDTLTAVMLVVVTVVSSIVHIYSIGYMHEDEGRARFFAYLSLFTFAMLMLVTADNFVQLFFGWEGVGLASYLLIGFWYKKPSANAAAMKAFIVNRVGDFGFALGIFGVFFLFGTLDFEAVFDAARSQANMVWTFAGMELNALTTICLLLFVGACGKSAQFMLHTWLPDAMEGPTPVSALIHAATMVTAGVFLVCRCSPMFEYAPDALFVVTVVGAITAFFAATAGLFQNDIKRVIAYSTCSQLGYMFVAAGLSAYEASMFHLFTHAFFKALLFLGAGSVIHALHHEQDMRQMGSVYSKIPVTWMLMLVGTLALTGVGIPLLQIGFAGFYSKDAIIEGAFASHSAAAPFAFVLLVAAAAMTSFYSWRLVFMTFHGPQRGDPHVIEEAHESPPVMLWPLFILAFGAIAAGFLFVEHFIGHDRAGFWKDSIFVAETNRHLLDEIHDVPKWVKFSPFVAMILGFLVAAYFYLQHPWLPAKMAARKGPLYLFLYNKWYVDELYDFIFVRPAKALGHFLWKKGDGWLIDGFGPDGIAARVMETTAQTVRLQTGYVYWYAFAMVIGVVFGVSYIFALGGQ
jgi:NADH-quinone oxidoreductase subunit L